MRYHRFAFVALALPLLAGCSDLVSNQSMGPQGPPFVPSGGAMFTTYVALGTSISAGVQSGGISDSTERQAFPYLLAGAMGLTPGANWFYPSFNNPGCPPPYTNPLTGDRVTPPGYPTSVDTSCYVRNPASVVPYLDNLGVPSIRAAQLLDISSVPFPETDTLFLAQFITGSRNPITEMMAAHPTFVTLEIGSNDVLGAALHGDTTLLTPVASFESAFSEIADSIDASGTQGVAVSNIPNVTVIPHFSAGVVFFCLKTGAAGCPVPATAPYSLATFTVDASCAPTAAGGVGDQMLVGFTATATITGTLAGGGAASLNCGAGTATVTDLSGTHAVGPVLAPASVLKIATAVATLNAYIQQQASTRGWAYVDLNGALATAVAGGQIPPFPDLTLATPLFGPLFSLDGIHPSAAGHKTIADLFVAAINAQYGSSLTPP
jgi:lysophospholipase L1-like esterase